jgi:hypothetical protein
LEAEGGQCFIVVQTRRTLCRQAGYWRRQAGSCGGDRLDKGVVRLDSGMHGPDSGIVRLDGGIDRLESGIVRLDGSRDRLESGVVRLEKGVVRQAR